MTKYSILGNPTPNPQNTRRLLLIIIAATTCFVLYNLASWSLPSPISHIWGSYLVKRRNVIIASDFPQYFDVHLAAAHTIREVLGDSGDVRVFAHTPLRHAFQDVVSSLDLFDKEIEDPDSFVSTMNTPSPMDRESGRFVDLVLFGTCEVDMNRWSDDLLEVWDSRPRGQKFVVVCIVHHFQDTNWQRHIAPWASRGAIRLLPIAYHVGRTFRARFQELADSPERDIYTSLYEYIPIDVHSPALHLPEYGMRRTQRILSRAVIQGDFESDERDYPNIFADLIAALQEDAEMWGYSPSRGGSEVYEVHHNSALEPFKLHLVGDGLLDIPEALENVVVIHRGLSYFDFYALMQSMDVVIPAFVNRDFYDYQASSTVAIAVQCNVPILASRRMRERYGYIDDDRVTVTRPQALREVNALGALRRASINTEALEDNNDRHGTNISASAGLEYRSDKFDRDVEEMIDQGWYRNMEGFESFKLDLWEKNREAIRRVLHDLPGEI